MPGGEGEGGVVATWHWCGGVAALLGASANVRGRLVE